jgi:hypothetical protein
MGEPADTLPQDPAVAAQLAWLAKVTGLAVLSGDNLKQAQDRKDGQDMMNLRLPDAEREAIRAALSGMTVKVGNKEMSILDAGGNANTEIDTFHHAPDLTQSLDAAQIKQLNTEMAKIYALEEELRKNPAYKLEMPTFTEVTGDDPAELRRLAQVRAKEEAEFARKKAEIDARIAEDLWLPLQRQGVIPENLVPQKYSAVVEQFDAASEAYEERREEVGRDMTEKDLMKEKFDRAMKIGKASVELFTKGATTVGEIADLVGNDGVAMGAKEAEAVLKHLGTAMSVTEGIGTTALTGKHYTSLGLAVGKAVGPVLMKHVGPEISTMVSTSIMTAARSVKIEAYLKKKDYEGAAQAIADGIAKGCAGFDKTDGKHVAEIGRLVQAGMGTFLNGWQAEAAISGGKDPGAVMQALVDHVTKIATEAAEQVGPKMALEFAGDGKAEPEENAEAEDEEEGGLGAKDAVTGAKMAKAAYDGKQKIDKANAVIAAKFDHAALEKQREDAAKKTAEDMQAMIDEGDEEFRLALVAGFSQPIDDNDEVNIGESNRLASIDYILAIQAKTAATFELCKTISQKGVGLVVKMFPGASLVEACLTLTFTIQDAIAKAQELIIWQDNFKDAQAASSAQVDAFLSRKGLQTKQTAQAGIQAALDAAKVVAEAMKLTPGAPAAPAVKASVEVVEASIKLADILYTEQQMAAAWRLYQQARDNPQDRYLARKATQKNPTLAKYAMAWGATKGDPIAVEGMRRCGLNEHTLAHPDTNIAKVVAYLEAKYADDPVLLRAVPMKQKWHPGPVELSLNSWTSFYDMATTKAVPAVAKTNDISGINAALGNYGDAKIAFDKAIDALIEENKTRRPAQVKENPGAPDEAISAKLTVSLYKLMDNLRRFKAVDEDGNPHPQMAAYVDALVAKTDQTLTAIEGILHDAKWADFSKAA